jgi:putative FmdB family regulatory protein
MLIGAIQQGRREVYPCHAYEFMCEKCQKPFELTMTISEHEKGKVRCPTCKSARVASQLSGFRRTSIRPARPRG